MPVHFYSALDTWGYGFKQGTIQNHSTTADSLLDLMEKLNREKEVTFLFSTHDQRVINRAKRIIRMRDGKLAS
jgi:putative ABC transport system ATP-binding protein